MKPEFDETAKDIVELIAAVQSVENAAPAITKFIPDAGVVLNTLVGLLRAGKYYPDAVSNWLSAIKDVCHQAALDIGSRQGVEQ